MKKWVGAFTLGILVISFQNCAKSNLGSLEPNQASQVNPAIETPVTSLEPAQAAAVALPNSPAIDAKIDSLQASPADANALNAYNLVIHTKTGIIDVIDANGDVDASKQFCLESAQIASLEGLLAASQICEGADESQNSDQLCQMEYSFPYAKLQFDGQSVSLGEKFSACHKGTDLCGNNAKQMKDFVSSVVSHLENQSCHFQSL